MLHQGIWHSCGGHVSEDSVGCHEIIASQWHHNYVTLTKCARRSKGGNGNGRMELKGFRRRMPSLTVHFMPSTQRLTQFFSTHGIQIWWKQFMLVSFFFTEKPLDIVVSGKWIYIIRMFMKMRCASFGAENKNMKSSLDSEWMDARFSGAHFQSHKTSLAQNRQLKGCPEEIERCVE